SRTELKSARNNRQSSILFLPKNGAHSHGDATIQYKNHSVFCLVSTNVAIRAKCVLELFLRLDCAYTLREERLPRSQIVCYRKSVLCRWLLRFHRFEPQRPNTNPSFVFHQLGNIERFERHLGLVSVSQID